MKLLVALVVVVLFAAFDQSACSVDSMWDSVKGAAGDVGEFFQSRFTDFKSLFANDENELNKNVQRVKQLLSTIKSKASRLESIASDSQKQALAKIDAWIGEINVFQEKMKDAVTSTFEQRKKQWEEMLKKMFDDEKLKDLVPLLNSTPKMSMVPSSVLVACTGMVIIIIAHLQ